MQGCLEVPGGPGSLQRCLRVPRAHVSVWVCLDPAWVPRGVCWWCPAGVLAARRVPLRVSEGAVQCGGARSPAVCSRV